MTAVDLVPLLIACIPDRHGNIYGQREHTIAVKLRTLQTAMYSGPRPLGTKLLVISENQTTIATTDASNTNFFDSYLLLVKLQPTWEMIAPASLLGIHRKNDSGRPEV